MTELDEDLDFWLHKIGATSPSFWSAVAGVQLRRVEEGVIANEEHRDHPAREPNSCFDGFAASLTHSFGPLQADSYFLLVAIRHVLALAESVLNRFGDDSVLQAMERFKRDAPDARDMRNVIAHLEEYAVGAGKLKNRGLQGHGMIQVGTDLVMRAGELEVDLRRATAAAQELSRAVNDRIPHPVRITPRHP